MLLIGRDPDREKRDHERLRGRFSVRLVALHEASKLDRCRPSKTRTAATALTALLLVTGIFRLISQKLRFVHYVQCRRLRSP